MNKYFGKRVHEGIAIGKIIKFVNKINITHTNGLGYDIEFERFNESRKKVIKEYQEIYENINTYIESNGEFPIISVKVTTTGTKSSNKNANNGYARIT